MCEVLTSMSVPLLSWKRALAGQSGDFSSRITESRDETPSHPTTHLMIEAPLQHRHEKLIHSFPEHL